MLFLTGLLGLMAAALAAPQSSTTDGEALFFGKAGCATCHEVNGRGGIVGPDLSAIGTRPADSLREKILNPGGNPAGGGRGGRPAVIVAKTQDGREIQGV